MGFSSPKSGEMQKSLTCPAGYRQTDENAFIFQADYLRLRLVLYSSYVRDRYSLNQDSLDGWRNYETFNLDSMRMFMCGHSFAQTEYDVVVYGGNSAGVIAAVRTAQMGKSVVLVAPEKHLGGLTSGGLGFTDTGDKSVIGD